MEAIVVRKSLKLRGRIAGVGVVAFAGLGLLGMSAGPVSAASGDVTAAAGGSAASVAIPSSVTETKYIATLEGCCSYHFNVFSNHVAKSSFIPNDGFKGVWTWSKNSSGVITFQQTNGTGCTWTAVKTRTGLNSVSNPGVADCGGTFYSWYAVKR
jgi:hypothetical protein